MLYTNVSCPCSHFSTPRQPHHRPRAGPGPAPAGARERVFDKSCSTYMFLPHVRSFRPPASPITGPELVPRRPRPELGNVYFPRGCARPRTRARAHARARARARARSPDSVFALQGGRRRRRGFCTLLSLRLSLRRTASQHIKDMLGC